MDTLKFRRIAVIAGFIVVLVVLWLLGVASAGGRRAEASVYSAPLLTPTPTATTTSQINCGISQTAATTSCLSATSFAYHLTFYQNCGTTPPSDSFFEVATWPDGPWTVLAQQSNGASLDIQGTFVMPPIPSQYMWYRVRVYGYAPPPHPSQNGQTDPAPLCGRVPACTPEWSQHAPAPQPVFSQAMAPLNGKVYSIGGRRADYVVTNEVNAYNPATDSWQARAPLPAPRYYASALNAFGTLFLINGTEAAGPTNTVFYYDDVTNTWLIGPSSGAPTYGQAVAASNNRVYRIGGIDADGVITSSVEAFAIVGLPPVTPAPLPEGRAWAAAISLGGYIYVAGGLGPSGTSEKTYRYDPIANTWDDAAIADLPSPRMDTVSGFAGGKWVLAGGNSTESSTLAWDPLTNTWAAGPDVPLPRHWAGGTALGNTLYVAGGLDNTTATADNQQYGPPLSCAVNTSTPSATNTPITPGPTSTSAGCFTYDPSGIPVTCTPTAVTGTPTATPSQTGTSTSTPVACTIAFADMPPSHTFYTWVMCLACRDIIHGYRCGGSGEPCNANNDPYFRPWANITRAQIAKIVVLAADITVPIPVGQQTFADVAPDTTFWLYVEQIAAVGAMQGYPCGGPGEPCGLISAYFRPNGLTTRGQLTKIVSQAAEYSDVIPAGTQTFQDVPEGSTFHQYVERLLIHNPNAMSGYYCGGPGEPCIAPQNRPYFRPANNVTRGQASKIVGSIFFPECSP